MLRIQLPHRLAEASVHRWPATDSFVQGGSLRVAEGHASSRANATAGTPPSGARLTIASSPNRSLARRRRTEQSDCPRRRSRTACREHSRARRGASSWLRAAATHRHTVEISQPFCALAARPRRKQDPRGEAPTVRRTEHSRRRRECPVGWVRPRVGLRRRDRVGSARLLQGGCLTSMPILTDHLDPPICDGSGYRVRERDLRFLQIEPGQLELWRRGVAPLGVSTRQYDGLRAALAAALDREHLSSQDCDVRIQGSAARFFSGAHKVLPTSRDALIDVFRELRYRHIGFRPGLRLMRSSRASMNHGFQMATCLFGGRSTHFGASRCRGNPVT